jgi:hypothetical protein
LEALHPASSATVNTNSQYFLAFVAYLLLKLNRVWLFCITAHGLTDSSGGMGLAN